MERNTKKVERNRQDSTQARCRAISTRSAQNGTSGTFRPTSRTQLVQVFQTQTSNREHQTSNTACGQYARHGTIVVSTVGTAFDLACHTLVARRGDQQATHYFHCATNSNKSTQRVSHLPHSHTSHSTRFDASIGRVFAHIHRLLCAASRKWHTEAARQARAEEVRSK